MPVDPFSPCVPYEGPTHDELRRHVIGVGGPLARLNQPSVLVWLSRVVGHLHRAKKYSPPHMSDYWAFDQVTSSPG